MTLVGGGMVQGERREKEHVVIVDTVSLPNNKKKKAAFVRESTDFMLYENKGRKSCWCGIERIKYAGVFNSFPLTRVLNFTWIEPVPIIAHVDH